MKAWLSRHPLLGLTMVAGLALVTGLGLSRLVISENQAAVDAEPPAYTALTAPVMLLPLQSTAPVDATIDYETSLALKPSAPNDGSIPIVTAIHAKQGDSVEAGSAILEVAGRPTFVLPGAINAYRTMGPGATGPDVAQLNQALRALGYDVPQDGTSFSSDTQNAVEAFYRDRGYATTVVGREEAAAAEQGLVAAERAERAASIALERAERELEAVSPKSSDRNTRDTAAVAAKDAVEDARQALEDASADLVQAQETLDAARSKAGPEIPVGEVAFVPSLPATLTAISVTTGADASEATFTLSSGALVAKATVSQAVAPKLTPDLSATIITTDGTQVEATLLQPVASKAQDTGAPTWEVTARPNTPLPDSLLQQPVRLLIQLETSEENHLQVPEAAVQTHADGRNYVEVAGEEGPKRVEVAISGSGDGNVAITPVEGAPDIHEGDEVIIGQTR